MRIKLRLYTRDMDLIALKHIPGVKLGSIIRVALLEYVDSGKVTPICVPIPSALPQLPQSDQIDVSFTGNDQKRVVEWINRLKPGYRSFAVKAVVRAAISNPILEMYALDSELLVKQETETPEAACAHTPLQQTPAYSRYPQGSESSPSQKKSKVEFTTNQNDCDEDLDLFEFDAFDNI